MSFVKQVRERLGVSQREFAKMLGVSRISVVRWEKGTALPGPVNAVLRLIDAMPEKALDVLFDSVQQDQQDKAATKPAAPTAEAGAATPTADFSGAGSPPPRDRPSDGNGRQLPSTPAEPEPDLGWWGPQEDGPP